MGRNRGLAPSPDMRGNDNSSGPVLQTSRLTLRLLCASDRSEFVRVHTESDDFFRPWMPVAPPEETVESLFEKQLLRAFEICADWSAAPGVAKRRRARLS